MLANPRDFVSKQLMEFEKDRQIDPEKLEKMKQYIQNPDNQAEKLHKVSRAALGLCTWILALYDYQ